MAPTYDHGAALGAGLRDDERIDRLTTRNPNRSIAAYVQRPRVRSPFFRNSHDERPLSPFEAFLEWHHHVTTGTAWIERLRALDDHALASQLSRVPAAWMSDPARNFVEALLRHNRQRILVGVTGS